MKLLWALAAAATSAHAYWLMGIEDFITTERMDPVVSPGKVSGHVHSVLGGSNFRLSTNTSFLRQSECTSIPIPQDKSNYWFPHLYFQWNNGSFTSLDGGAVMYYLFSDSSGVTTAFPDDFRMLSGDPTLRTYDPNSHAQQAVTFLCLDFNGVSTKHNELPSGSCPSGIRAQINFPSCWDGKNLDSPDHKSHVAFLSGGPDTGTCSDPKFPVVLPRIFIEVYWASNDFDNVRSQAMNSTQPFVYSYGDATGYGYHADFINGWDAGVLQKAVDNCHCNPYGDPTCCVDQGLFDMNQGKNCRITKSIDEQTTGTLLKLPGNNPVQPFGKQAVMFAPDSTPALLSPVFAYTGDSPTATGNVVTPGQTNALGTTPMPTQPVIATTSSAKPTSVVVPTSSASATSVAVPTSSTIASSSAQHTTSKATTSKPATTTAFPTFTVPTFSMPPIPTISIPAGFPSISIPHVLSVNTAKPTATAVAASAPSAIAAPANGAPVALPASGGSASPASGGSSSPASGGKSAPASGGTSSPASGGISSPASGGSKTCSKKSKVRLSKEKHHHRNSQHHARHLDYVYDMN